MSKNPYFAHLPTKQNRQDLVFALDSIPRLLTSNNNNCNSNNNNINNNNDSYYSPPGSPCSPYATLTHGSYHSSSPWSTLSSTSSSSSTCSSTSSSSSISTFYQHQYQQRLIQRHIRRSSSHSHKSTLQFSTRAQAMGFLINLLQSFQQEPCECDLVQGCFCSPEGVEDHSGLAPCYVCGEWYAEQVFCRNEDSEEEEYSKVDGRSWHERGGASLRHQVAETRVRQWLDHVVVPIASAATWSSSPQSPYYQQQHQEQDNEREQQQCQPTIIRSRPGRSASCPAPVPAVPTVSIPEEILDPTTRSPGFRIKRRDTIATERPSRLPSLREEVSSASNTSFSAPSSASSTLTNTNRTPFRFSFTSERFNAAIQESLSRRSSVAVAAATVTSPVANTAHNHSPSASNNTTTTTTTFEHQAEAVTVAVQVQEQKEQDQAEAEPGKGETETETASPSAQSTKATTLPSSLSSSSSVSSLPSLSRGSSITGTTTIDRSFHGRDQCGVAVASTVTATVAQQHFSSQPSMSSPSVSSPSVSSSVSTRTGSAPPMLPNTIGKTELESQAHTSQPLSHLLPQDQQHEGRGRARRRGQGHIRQPAQSHILVMGSFLQELQQQKEKEQAEIGETSGPMVSSKTSSSSSSLSSQVATRSRSNSRQRGLSSTHVSLPLSLTPSTPPSPRAKRTVSFSLPLPTIVISPPPPPNTTTEAQSTEAVGEWRSCCNTQSPNMTPPPPLPIYDNNNTSHNIKTPPSLPSSTTRHPALSLGLGLLQTVYKSALAIGWWSCSSLGGTGLLFFSSLPSVVSAFSSASSSSSPSTCT